jgi:hypothetical protein
MLIAAMMCFGGANAEPASVNTTKDSGSISAADLAMQPRYKLGPTEFSSVRGVYTLSDGRRLKVWTERHKLLAETNNHTVEILPVAKNTFVSADGSTRLRFDFDDFEPTVVVTEK